MCGMRRGRVSKLFISQRMKRLPDADQNPQHSGVVNLLPLLLFGEKVPLVLKSLKSRFGDFDFSFARNIAI